MIKNKESLHSIILGILYESKKIILSRSLNRYANYEINELYKNQRKEKLKEIKNKQKISKAIYYLKKQNFIYIKNGQVNLSNKGLFKYLLHKSSKIKTKKTTNKYLIIFDIPEDMKKIRENFRKILYNLGATKIQRSVFLLKDIKAYYFIKKTIKDIKMTDNIKIFTCR